MGFGLRSLADILEVWDRDAFEVRAHAVVHQIQRGYGPDDSPVHGQFLGWPCGFWVASRRKLL